MARASKRAAASLKIAAAIEALESRILFAAPTVWTPQGPGAGGAYFSPSFNPTNPNDIWVTSDESPMLNSTNLGQSWSVTNFNQFQGGVNSLVQFTSSPSVLYSIDGAKGPNKSIDGGVTWNPMSGWNYGLSSY